MEVGRKNSLRRTSKLQVVNSCLVIIRNFPKYYLAVILKLEHVSESFGGLIKTQITDCWMQPSSFQGSIQEFVFLVCFWRCCCCCSECYPLRTTFWERETLGPMPLTKGHVSQQESGKCTSLKTNELEDDASPDTAAQSLICRVCPKAPYVQCTNHTDKDDPQFMKFMMG